MTGLCFQLPWALLALLLVPGLAALFRFARRRRAELLAAFGGARSSALARWVRRRTVAERCTLIAVTLLIFALARPGANPRPRTAESAGRDIVFVLDVSRSMLAQDTRPSRLERAKADIASCLDTLTGAQVGLVVFAGTAAIRSPLTADYDFLRMMLRDVGPNSVAHGSTYLQSAFEKVADQVLTEEREGYQDVILLTDGEDQGSNPETALEGLAARQARLLVIGYGTPVTGARIPADEEGRFLEHDGREVWTVLQRKTLQILAAAAPAGAYLDGGASNFLLGSAYQRWAEPAPRYLRQEKAAVVYDEYFAWFLVPALALLLVPIPLRRAAPLVLCLLLGTAAATEANEPTEEEAFERLAASIEQATNPEDLAAGLYGLALAHAGIAERNGDAVPKLDALQSAIQAMRRAVLLVPDWTKAIQGLEVLYVRRTEAEVLLEQQQQQQDEMNDAMQALYEELTRLHKEQQALWQRGRELERAKNMPPDEKRRQVEPLRGQQELLAEQTDAARVELTAMQSMVREMSKQLALLNPSAPPTEEAPKTEFDLPLEYMAEARQAQDRAAGLLGPLEQLNDAVIAKNEATEALKAILKELAGDQGEGEGDEFDDEDWDEYDESEMSSDQSGAADQSMPAGGDLRSDFVNRALPRPDFSVEDLLAEEEANNQIRAERQPARVSEVEKDW